MKRGDKATTTKAVALERARARRNASWRVYDAICDLGFADSPMAYRTEIERARKAAWERFRQFVKALERLENV
jgi:hypothetical protein